MKFEEKLIYLRKRSNLSQEGLAEKLDVTRQTVSKWELGQSKPDMDKLMLMSKLFDVSIDVLTDDLISFDEKVDGDGEKNIIDKPKKGNNKGQNKFVIYILIILLVASFGVLSYRLLNSYNNKNEEEESFFQGIFNKIYDTFDKIYNTFDNVDDTFDIDDVDDVFDKADDIISGQDKDSFNRDFEFYQGTQYGSRVRSQIDRVITNNNKNSDHLIEVIFDGNSYGTDPDSIRDIKKELKDFSDNGHGFQYYEIALYYDDNGYVYKITIETV